MGPISATELKARLQDGSSEIAVLDVRAESRFGQAHLLAASSAPLSDLEVLVYRLVPRNTTPIVLCSDAEDGLAVRAQEALAARGYTHVRVLSGGLANCERAGLQLFAGLNTQSKALAAYAQHKLAVQEISVEALAADVRAGKQVQVIDCRPAPEYARGTIPGAMNCPGGDLPRSVACALDPQVTYVMTCAGRSRGLTSAQLLKDQNIAAEVLALSGGTMGWELSGQSLQANAARAASIVPTTDVPLHLLSNAQAIRTRQHIRMVSSDELRSLRADPERTTVLFDVRSRQEFTETHITGARHVAGGQLIHNIDMHIATRGALLVICDDDGVRATSIALWIKRLGLHDVCIATLADGGHDTAGGAPADPTPAPGGNVHTIAPRALRELLRQNKAVVLDLASSRQYRKGHLPGAQFCKRILLGETLPQFADAPNVVLTSEDGVSAIYAAEEHARPGDNLSVLEGGTTNWSASGYDLASGLECVLHEPDDVYLKPSELPKGAERSQAMKDYLGGSQATLDQALKEGTLPLQALSVHDLGHRSTEREEVGS